MAFAKLMAGLRRCFARIFSFWKYFGLGWALDPTESESVPDIMRRWMLVASQRLGLTVLAHILEPTCALTRLGEWDFEKCRYLQWSLTCAIRNK